VYHPTTRLLTALELLQSRRQLSGPELAERLEVDARSVRRYISMLQELGIPVEAVRGRYGAYRLRPGYKLPPLMFSEEEALALVLGLATARRLGLAEPALAAEGALAKIERVLPVALREQVQAVQESLVLALNVPGFMPASELVVTFGLAVRQSRQVWLRYRAWHGEESERLLDPYGLVYREGYWYSVGFCHLRQDIRVFRLDRVIEAQLRNGPFTRPTDFNALEHVERAIAQTPDIWKVLVLLKTTLAEARRQLPPALAILEETADGVLMRCHVDSMEWIAYLLAGLDCSFIIQEPAELREALAKLGARLARLAEQEAPVQHQKSHAPVTAPGRRSKKLNMQHVPSPLVPIVESSTDDLTLSLSDQSQPSRKRMEVTVAATPRRAYQRTIQTRLVTFTCVQCGATVTEQCFPGPPPRFCTKACQQKARRVGSLARVHRFRDKQRERASEEQWGAKSSERLPRRKEVL
jgi:predicted DNA-binding transcriptional regulator YafY